MVPTLNYQARDTLKYSAPRQKFSFDLLRCLDWTCLTRVISRLWLCKAESRSGNFPHFVKGNVLRRRGEEIASVDVVFADLPGQVLSCQVLVAGVNISCQPVCQPRLFVWLRLRQERRPGSHYNLSRPPPQITNIPCLLSLLGHLTYAEN